MSIEQFLAHEQEERVWELRDALIGALEKRVEVFPNIASMKGYPEGYDLVPFAEHPEKVCMMWLDVNGRWAVKYGLDGPFELVDTSLSNLLGAYGHTIGDPYFSKYGYFIDPPRFEQFPKFTREQSILADKQRELVKQHTPRLLPGFIGSLEIALQNLLTEINIVKS